MPRSKGRIRIDNRAIERGKAIILKGLEGFTGKYQATVIAERIRGNAVLWGKLQGDRPLDRYLKLEGLKILIREALAEWGFGTPREEAPPQLELFPPDEQDLVRQIALARIWVPSRNAHIQYHDVDPRELEEASAYYISLGRGISRKGTLLAQLAAVRRKHPPAARAA